MDEETQRCRNFVKAILTTAIRDMTLPYGDLNNRLSCREAFDFMVNDKSDSYQDFLFWCDLADLDAFYWHRTALMNLAFELCERPWLRTRIISFLKGRVNRLLLREYYHLCLKQDNNQLGERLKNENIA